MGGLDLSPRDESYALLRLTGEHGALAGQHVGQRDVRHDQRNGRPNLIKLEVKDRRNVTVASGGCAGTLWQSLPARRDDDTAAPMFRGGAGRRQNIHTLSFFLVKKDKKRTKYLGTKHCTTAKCT